MKNSRNIEQGTPEVDPKYSISIVREGPILVQGSPELKQQFIVQNEEGKSWEYKDGKSFDMRGETVALCRCGNSSNKPYCDGTHMEIEWDSELTAENRPVLENAEVYDGQTLQLTDNPRYCAFARFCDAYGQVWNLVEHSDDSTGRELTIREANYCPAGRLKVVDKGSGKFIEHPHKPSLGLIEDPALKCSGPLWVKGGIPINDDSGKEYERRNRVTLCRCGKSSNKPFCDGTHAQVKFNDNL